MWQTLIVIAVVAAAAFYVGRRYYRAFKAKGPACACGGCADGGPSPGDLPADPGVCHSCGQAASCDAAAPQPHKCHDD